MSANTVIVAGAGIVKRHNDAACNSGAWRVDSCGAARRLLDRNRSVSLVCTDVRLSDGNWCDILRLVVDLRMSAEVRVLACDGHPALRLQVTPHDPVLALNAALLEAEPV